MLIERAKVQLDPGLYLKFAIYFEKHFDEIWKNRHEIWGIKIKDKESEDFIEDEEEVYMSELDDF